MKNFKSDLEKHLNDEYIKYKEYGIHDNYQSGYCGAIIGIMNWIKEYEFVN